MWQPSGRQRAVDGPPKTEDFAFCGDFAFCRMTRVLEGGAIGLDLGKRQEYTALTAAAEREEWEQYRRTFEDRAQTQMARRRVLSERWLQHLWRWPLVITLAIFGGHEAQKETTAMPWK